MDFEYLGPYKIESLLGKGGMGAVYKARHAKTGEEVAVKIIAESIANQERFRRRFDAEIESLRQLSNKHIVKLIGYGEEKGRLFYSMEYVQGETLHDKIKRQAVLSWQDTLRYAINICSALKHAHDIGVIHRDLKPSNLLIDQSDNIKITDFGIAKLYGSSEETALGSILGTADFMPPEQAEGTRVTRQSDLYALGAVMYTCLSGRSPHYAKTTPETLYNVRYKIPDPLSERIPGIPRELDILILELLEKDAKHRPKTALVVWNRLAAMQAGLSKFQEPQLYRTTDTAVADGFHGKSHTSIDLSELDPNLAKEAKQKQPDATPTRIQGDMTEAMSPGGPGTRGQDVTFASEELIAASHMGHTTNVATHLTSLTSDAAARVSPTTRFTTVEEDAPFRRRMTFDTQEDRSNAWTNVLSIATLSIAIIACVAAIYYSTRKPSADSLYAATSSAVERSSSLDTIEAALENFRRNYPGDPRLKEFDDYAEEISMQRKVNSLSRRVRRAGDSAIAPLELAFVEAMQMREKNESQAIQELQDFLVVFQDRNLLNPEQKELVDYAARELQRLTQIEHSSSASNTNYLSEQLAAATQLPVKKRRQFYESVVRLYADKPFASEIVARAKRLLSELPLEE